MRMDWVEIVGYFGSFLSAITFFPQVYKAWKTKSVGDLSMAMILIVFTSTIVWIVYGVAKNIGPVILCNSIMFVLVASLIYFKLTFKK